MKQWLEMRAEEGWGRTALLLYVRVPNEHRNLKYVPPSSIKTQNEINATNVSLYSDKLWQIKLDYRPTGEAPKRILLKFKGQFCFDFLTFAQWTVLIGSTGVCMQGFQGQLLLKAVALTLNQEKNGSSSLRDQHEVGTLLTNQQVQKKDDLLFLTVQFSPCRKKEGSNYSCERTLIHKPGSGLSFGSFSRMKYTQLSLLTFGGQSQGREPYPPHTRPVQLKRKRIRSGYNGWQNRTGVFWVTIMSWEPSDFKRHWQASARVCWWKVL